MAPIAESVAVLPKHGREPDELAVTVGLKLTVCVKMVELEQPVKVLVPDKVKTVVTAGVRLIVVVCRLVGFQVKVFAPVANKVTPAPKHNPGLLDVTLRIGKDLVAIAKTDVPNAPQALDAAREILPALPTVALMVFVDEAPVQPPGKVQV